MHTIFLVHGMGEFAAGWSNDLQRAIQGFYDPTRYAFLKNWDFNETFQFKEITYDTDFTRYLEQAKDHAADLSKWSKLASGLSGGVLGVMQRVVQAAGQAPADNFLVNSLGDVAFYVASDISELVRNDVAVQISAALDQNFDPASDNWSIIGHSLGTRVVTDILQAGFSGAPSLRAFGKARVMMQVANVSRLIQDVGSALNSWGDVYHGVVYPSVASANGCCRHFINATHRLDPFAFVHEFDPPATFGDERVFLDNLDHAVRLPASDITDKNVHAIEHYMLHPMVHTTLFQYLIPGSGARGPTAQEMKTVMDEYRQKTLTQDITNTWRASLAALKSNPFQSFDEVFSLWEKFGQLLK